MANTTRFNYLIPDVGLDEDAWGDKLNAYFDQLEGRVFDKDLGDTTPSVVVTDSLTIPVLTTAQRDLLTPTNGLVVFNTDINQYEGYFAALMSWASLGGGATGGGADQVFVLNDQVVTEDYTIPVGKNAHSAGPITIADGVTVTIPDNSTWVIS